MKNASISPALWLILLLGMLVLTVILSLAVGARAIPLNEVFESLFGQGPDRIVDSVVIDQRLPRTLVGILAGAALGVAGALMQSVTRNPIADPGLLGVSAGAALAVVLAIEVLGEGSPTAYAPFAMAGAALASIVVYGLASGPRSASPVRLALAGAALAAMLGSVTTAIVLLDRSTLEEFRFWAVGSLAGRELSVFVDLLPFAVAGLFLAIALSNSLNALALGDDMATALGRRVGRVRFGSAAAATLLCGAAVAAAGPIAFVGLAVPHAARSIVRIDDHRYWLPACALIGAIFILLADVAGRIIASPSEVQVGIVTAALGAPFLIYLVNRRGVVSS